MNIRSIYIDFDKNILEINGFPIKRKQSHIFQEMTGGKYQNFSTQITQPKNATVFVLL